MRLWEQKTAGQSHSTQVVTAAVMRWQSIGLQLGAVSSARAPIPAAPTQRVFWRRRQKSSRAHARTHARGISQRWQCPSWHGRGCRQTWLAAGPRPGGAGCRRQKTRPPWQRGGSVANANTLSGRALATVGGARAGGATPGTPARRPGKPRRPQGGSRWRGWPTAHPGAAGGAESGGGVREGSAVGGARLNWRGARASSREL